MKDKPGERSITITTDSKLENVSLIGIAVRGICTLLPFASVDEYHMELCIVEAVNNVIKHSYNLKPGHTVKIQISIFDDRIVFQICDTGKKMESVKHDLPHFETENIKSLPEKGMGLFLIGTAMDEIQYETVGKQNLLTMTKYFTTASA